MSKNSKRFPIHIIASLGCRGCELMLDGEPRDELQMELVSFMLWNERVSKFGLEHMRASIRDEIRRQFPAIDFQSIEDRARKIFGRTYDARGRKFKAFIKSLENSHGRTRVVHEIGDDFVYPEKHFYATGITPEYYVCAICGASGVKLWRPYMDTEPFVCASCAEERQSPHTYDVIAEWVPGKFPNGDDCWTGTYEYEISPSGERVVKKAPMDKWVVNDEGKVPSYIGSPGPDGKWGPMTDQLSINLSGISKSYSSGDTSMIPAVPDKKGEYWGYTSVPEEGCKWWDKLPTHKLIPIT